MSIFRFLIILIPIVFVLNANAIGIIASGEIHGLISSCNCPDDPGGGIASISTIIKGKRKTSDILLVDAGGFSAGGIYDLYTSGHSNDSIKTRYILDAMGIAEYDAIAVGDEELQYDPLWLKETAKQYGLKLVSANILKTDSSFWFDPFTIVEKSGVKFLITSLAPNDQILNIAENVNILDPLDALNLLLERVDTSWDILIVLSHLGEENSRIIYNKMNSFKTIVINGHRKASTEAGEINNNNGFIQFGFQGKKLSLINFNSTTNELSKPFWIKNSEKIERDVPIAHLSDEFNTYIKANRKEVYDLYIMSQCPYGLPVLNDLHSYLNKMFVKSELNIWFIGDIDSIGKLRSLHGKEEIKEELLWLAIHKKYPKYWSIFLSLVSSREFSTNEAIEELRLDTNTINSWINKYGLSTLKMHYNRSNRLSIDASPTLFLNNKPFKGEMTSLFLRAKHCSQYNLNKMKCDSLPDCFVDSDCLMDGYLGRCNREINNWGKCEFSKAYDFNFSIITSENLVFKVDQDMINTTKQMFPGASIHIMDIKNDSTKIFIEKFDVNSLPFAFFSKDVSNAINFKSIEEGIKPFGENYIFKNEYVAGTYLFKRDLISNKVELFINLNLLSESIKNILINFIKNYKGNSLKIYPLIDDGDTSKICNAIQFSKDDRNDKILIDSTSNHIMNGEKISKLEIVKYYKNYTNKYNAINGNHPFVILLNNREVVIPHNNKETEVILNKIISNVK